MAHVNLLKQFKTGKGWVLKSIPRKPNGQRDWGALPDGSYFIEWREEGKRMRWPAGRSVSQALEAQAGGTRSNGGRNPPALQVLTQPGAGTHATVCRDPALPRSDRRAEQAQHISQVQRRFDAL